MTGKKYFFIFFLQLVFAREILIDNFDTITKNLTVLPKSPAVILSLSRSNVIGSQGNALRLTTKYEQNKPILQYDLKNNGKYFDASGYQSLVFYVKSDTDTDLEVALGDPVQITPFTSVLPYLPRQKMQRNWQPAIIYLDSRQLNKKQLDAIYFKIVTSPEKNKDIVYLDNIIFSDELPAAEPNPKVGLVIYDFDQGLSSQYKGAPQSSINPPGQLELKTTGQGHFGSAGESLLVSFNTRECGPAELILPLAAKDFGWETGRYKYLTLQLRASPELVLRAGLVSAEAAAALKNLTPYYQKEYLLQTAENSWTKITLPLAGIKKLTGLKISLPKNSQGVFYLDNILLE